MDEASRGKLSTGAERAEALAIAALGFVAEDPDRLDRFLALTGLGPHNLREAAAAPGFAAAVLDHVLGDERMVVAFADHAGVAPQDVARARAVLGGPPPP